MTVINIDDHKPHLSGRIKCASCHHEWVGVCPIDPDGNAPCLECPNCSMMQGFFMHPICASEDKMAWRCTCSGETFMITPDGALCIRCGLTHPWDEILA